MIEVFVTSHDGRHETININTMLKHLEVLLLIADRGDLNPLGVSGQALEAARAYVNHLRAFLEIPALAGITETQVSPTKRESDKR